MELMKANSKALLKTCIDLFTCRFQIFSLPSSLVFLFYVVCLLVITILPSLNVKFVLYLFVNHINGEIQTLCLLSLEVVVA